MKVFPILPCWRARTALGLFAYLTGSGLLPDSEEGIFASTVLLQAGDRVLWLAEEVQGMDYNCGPAPDNEAGQCPMPAVLEQAAQDLLR